MDLDSFLYALAGIGLIFLGSKVFTHNLQSITGPFVRFIVNRRTDNLLRTNLIGGVLSLFNQSSMGISYMILAYMNAGLMNLGQGIHMLIGAQLGLTSAAWFLNVGFDTRAMFFLLFLGFIPAVFGQRRFVSQMSRCFFGLGLMLLGIEFVDKLNLFLIPVLGNYVSMLPNDPGFYKMFLSSFFVAAILSSITRSKLLVIAVAFSLLKTFSFGPMFSLSIAMGLGLGGAIPQLIVSFALSSATKRLAFGYLLVEILSISILLLSLEVLGQKVFVQSMWIGGTGFSLIYTFYSLFVIFVYSLTSKILFHPLLNMLVPAAKYKEAKSLQLKGDLGDISTALAIDLVEQELKKMSAMVEIQLDLSRSNLLSKLGDKSIEKKVSKYEKITDNIESEVGSLINQLLQRSLQKDDVIELRSFLIMTEELENLSDSSEELINLARDLRKEEDEIPGSLLKQLRSVGNYLQEYYIQSFTALMEGSKQPESHIRLRDKIGEELKEIKLELRNISEQDLLSTDSNQCLYEIYSCYKRILHQAKRFGESVEMRQDYLAEDA